MKELWDKSLKPEHFKGGFRAAGLFPLSQEISHVKLATSIPYTRPTGKEIPENSTETCSMHLTCTDCGRRAGGSGPAGQAKTGPLYFSDEIGNGRHYYKLLYIIVVCITSHWLFSNGHVTEVAGIPVSHYWCSSLSTKKYFFPKGIIW